MIKKHAFLKYLREVREKQIEEDAVVAADSTAFSSSSEVASPSEVSDFASSEVTSPNSVVGLTDNSVLGKISKKKNCGFFGKDNFFIPQNVLSGSVEVEEPKYIKKKKTM